MAASLRLGSKDGFLRTKDPVGGVSDDVKEAREQVFSNIFRGRDDWSFSSVLRSLKSTMMECMSQARPIASGSATQTGMGLASSLANSAIQYRDRAESLNAIFNIEMTAALLQYILTKVCFNYSKFFKS